MKSKLINIPIYNKLIEVFFGSHEEFIDYVLEEYKDNIPLVDLVITSDCSNDSADFWWIDGFGIIELPKYPETPDEIGIANHEILHAVFDILDYCGVEYTSGASHEAFTYLMEYISE